MSDRRRAWRRISRGLCVAGFGVFLLLNTTGVVPWSFWLLLLPLWPVLLIAIGTRLVFERSRFAAGVLLSPLLILGTMAWVAAAGAPASPWTHGTLDLEARRPEGIERWTLEGTVAHGQLHLGALEEGAETLVEGEATTRTGTPVLRTSGGGRSLARVRFRRQNLSRVLVLGRKWSGWRMNLARDLPVDLDLDLVLAEGDLDLEHVPVGRIDMEGAFNDVEITLSRPEKDVHIRIESAFSGYELRVPDGVPVRVESDGFMNLTSGRGRGTGPGYRIHLVGAFNRLDLVARKGGL
jgi:hypothetical protein